MGEPSLAQVCGCREQVEHPFARGQEPDVEQSRRVVPGFRWAEIADHDAVLDEEQPAGRHRPRECVPRALRCGDHDVRGEQHEAGKPAPRSRRDPHRHSTAVHVQDDATASETRGGGERSRANHGHGGTGARVDVHHIDPASGSPNRNGVSRCPGDVGDGEAATLRFIGVRDVQEGNIVVLRERALEQHAQNRRNAAAVRQSLADEEHPRHDESLMARATNSIGRIRRVRVWSAGNRGSCSCR